MRLICFCETIANESAGRAMFCMGPPKLKSITVQHPKSEYERANGVTTGGVQNLTRR